jgi:hydrogenase small subunit
MGADGVFCDIGGHITMKDAFDTLARNADAILAVGTCACYGGIPAAPGNPTEAVSVTGAMDLLGITKGVVNIPGCPIHPEWFVDTVVKILAGQFNIQTDLDSKGRPAFLFGDANSERIHNSCPMKGTGQAANLGVTGCKRNQGCRGEFAWGKCPSHKWNNGVSWCVQTQSTCTGCTEPSYPGAEPLFEYYTPPTS